MHEQRVMQVPFGEGRTAMVLLEVDLAAIAKELAMRVRMRIGAAASVGKEATAIDHAIKLQVLSVEGEIPKPRKTRKGVKRK